MFLPISEVIEAIVRERNNPNAPIQIFWVGAFTYMLAHQVILCPSMANNLDLDISP